jgi:hypothetical protein
MHRAHLGDLQQSGSLRLVQCPGELEGPIHAIQLSCFRFALGTVGCMNPGMPQPDDDVLERPSLSSRVQRDRHRRSTAECRKQEVVRSWAGIGAAVRDRFVRGQAMRAGRDLLGEPESRTANDDFCLVRHIVGGHGARIVRPASPGKSHVPSDMQRRNSHAYGVRSSARGLCDRPRQSEGGRQFNCGECLFRLGV